MVAGDADGMDHGENRHHDDHQEGGKAVGRHCFLDLAKTSGEIFVDRSGCKKSSGDLDLEIPGALGKNWKAYLYTSTYLYEAGP